MRHYHMGIWKRGSATRKHLCAAVVFMVAGQIFLAPSAFAAAFTAASRNFFAVNAASAAALQETKSPPGAVGLLPDMKGWTKDGEAQVFTPESLFEYIDGAADAYLAFEFEELAVLSYDGGNKRSVTIEIYRHADLRNAFGIYTQERPQQGNFVEIGTEAYYEKGIFNFFHGSFYVKTAGYHLEGDDEAVLTAAAAEVASRIGGKPSFPELLECFPAEGRVARSERFMARDVLGHGFLHGAYAADYGSGGEVVRLFLFEGKDEEDARRMLDDYLKLSGAAPSSSAAKGAPETHRFNDPRRTSGESANFRLAGRFLWGLFAPNDAATAYMDRIESNLRERGLIE
jgi:hypothetical protein